MSISKCLIVLLVGTFIGSAPLKGQALSDQELIARLKINKMLFPNWDRGPSLKDRITSETSDIFLKPIVSESSIACEACPKADDFDNPETEVAAKGSDLVVIGSVTRNVSAFTERNAFIFTDSEFSIEEIVKTSDDLAQSMHLGVGSEITVASIGGMMHVNGHTVRAYPSNLIPLVPGKRYLLFLKYLPQSSSFSPTALEGFELGSTAITPLRSTRSVPGQSLLTQPDTFMKAMRSSITHAASEGAR